jgi:hypothetical protein
VSEVFQHTETDVDDKYRDDGDLEHNLERQRLEMIE